MRVLVLQHIACEHPGVFSEVMRRARRRGRSRSSSTRASRSRTGASSSAVLAMGGPMGAGDDAEHPWLATEKSAWSARRSDARPALPRRLPRRPAPRRRPRRARSGPLERPEVGLLPVELTEEGRVHPLFAGVERSAGLAAVARRHLRAARRERYGSPRSPLAANQAFALGRARLRRPVPPRGDGGDGAGVGRGARPTASSLAAPWARRRAPSSSPRSSAGPRSCTRPRAACSPTGSTSRPP